MIVSAGAAQNSREVNRLNEFFGEFSKIPSIDANGKKVAGWSVVVGCHELARIFWTFWSLVSWDGIVIIFLLLFFFAFLTVISRTALAQEATGTKG